MKTSLKEDLLDDRNSALSRKLVIPAVRDIIQSITQLNLIIYFAASDLKARYRRSVLGPFWLSLSTLVGAVGLGLLWSELMRVPKDEFVPALTAGLIVWQLISSTLTESTTLFMRQASVIKNIRLPLSLFPAQLIFRQFFNLLHTAPVFFIMLVLMDIPLKAQMWLAIPGLIVVFLNLLWISLLFALLGARFRDLEFLVVSIIPILMLISPVFYRPKYLPFSETIIWMNPFSHLIEIIRFPLLGESVPNFVVSTNIVMLVFGTVITLWLFNRKLHRITFWL